MAKRQISALEVYTPLSPRGGGLPLESVLELLKSEGYTLDVPEGVGEQVVVGLAVLPQGKRSLDESVKSIRVYREGGKLDGTYRREEEQPASTIVCGGCIQ